MSRSHKKHYFLNYTVRSSAKWGKRYNNGKERMEVRNAIKDEQWDEIWLKTKYKGDKKWEWKEGPHYSSPWDNQWCHCQTWTRPEVVQHSYYDKDGNHFSTEYSKKDFYTHKYTCEVCKDYSGDYYRYLKSRMRK